MRYVNIASLYNLGLTEEEINFLKPQAEKLHQQFCTAHQFSDTRKFSDNLYTGSSRGSLGRLQSRGFVEAEVNYYLSTWSPREVTRGTVEPRFDERGFGLEHSSYGSISVSKPSSNRTDLVGSASLMGYYLDIRFSFCEVNVRDVREPSLFPRNELLTLSLSSEQFFALLRSNNQAVPCRVQQMMESYTDLPPILYPTLAKAHDYENQLKAICAPLAECMKRFESLVEAGVSKKAERDAVVQVIQEAKDLFDAARLEINAMTGGESRKEILRVERQFEVEMTNRLKSLGLEHLRDQVLRLRG